MLRSLCHKDLQLQADTDEVERRPDPALVCDSGFLRDLGPFLRLCWSLYNGPWGSLVAQLVKNLPAMQETSVRFLDQENPLEKGYVLAWKIPWTGMGKSMGLQSQTRLSDFHFHCFVWAGGEMGSGWIISNPE